MAPAGVLDQTVAIAPQSFSGLSSELRLIVQYWPNKRRKHTDGKVSSRAQNNGEILLFVWLLVP